MRDIKTRAPPGCDIVLCGNKSDLDNDRVVSSDEEKELSDEYGVHFFKTSALTGSNVETMFTASATTIKRKRIDEVEGAASEGPGNESIADQSQRKNIDLGQGRPNAEGGARSMMKCC